MSEEQRICLSWTICLAQLAQCLWLATLIDIPFKYNFLWYIFVFLLPCSHRFVTWKQLQQPRGGCNCLHRCPSYSRPRHGCLLCIVHQTEKNNHSVTSPDWERRPFMHLTHCQVNTSSSTNHDHYAAEIVKQVMRHKTHHSVIH